ncbi:MAG: glycoside hydrolase N-terminal domain-containing protein [Actinoplanes sp.]
MAEMTGDACTTLGYRTPAAQWTDALPLGNGRLGAMCFGGVEADRFQLNEGTCWSGAPTSDAPDPAAPRILAAARAALAADDVRAAEEHLGRLQGGHSQAYQPLADLRIEQAFRQPTDGYFRHLDLRSAVASHTFHGGAERVSQEAWISAPAQALVIRRRLRRIAAEPMLIRLGSPHPGAVASPEPGGLDLLVRMPSDVPPAPGPVRHDGPSVTALVGLRVVSAGLLTAVDGGVRLDDADEVIVVVAVVTDYVDPLTRPHGDVAELRRALHDRLDELVVALAHPGGYATMRAAHERDHARLFARAGLRLGPVAGRTPLDIDARLADPDPSLAALQFQYGRYLLIASSRPGGLPATLQGLWNEHLRPPWSSNYTTNINLEMNYWPAEVANLAECHQPLFDWLSFARRRSAPYGLSGWTLHHNSDAWCFNHPTGTGGDDPCWSFWPLAGAWLSRHLTDHHDFAGPLASPAEHVPIVRDAAAFCLDWLVEMPDGTLGTSPSTSPENHYLAPDGKPAAAGVSTTADLALIRGLLTDLIRLAPADPLAGRARAALPRIPAERVAGDGRLAEWSTDVADTEPEHRHTSHLVGLYPFATIDPDTTPAPAVAARRTLDARGPESTGWSLAWRIALRARLHDAPGAAAMVRRFLRPATSAAGVYRNLFCAHPPFQLDGNLGFTAGVAEMLLQSHATTPDVTRLHLLPALPADWAEGEFTGLRARGGVTVDASWSAGRLRSVSLQTDRPRAIEVRSAGWRTALTTTPGITARLTLDAV